MGYCIWAGMNEANRIYHDTEWGVPEHNDQMLFELLILEGFQAGLSWECILNKRAAFRAAFDRFDAEKVAAYNEAKVATLMAEKGIVRNRRKILAAVTNAKVFLKIQQEYGSFDRYIWQFTAGEIVHEIGKTSSPLSDRVSADLQKRGMRFVGTTIVYSYLQAIGVIHSHEKECGLYLQGASHA